MAFANNATRLLAARHIDFRIHEYDYDGGVHSAVEVAVAIGLPPERVFKTLVALRDAPGAKPVLAVIPGPSTLNLKSLAAAARTKKMRMAMHAQAEQLTGLQTGGISPIVLFDKGFAVFVDSSARQYQTIAVSAGQRGVNLELAPDDLVGLTRARVVALCP